MTRKSANAPPATAPPVASTRTPPGTQALERGVHILKELATRPRVGWGLTELAMRCELDKATTHRIVGGLLRQRLAVRHPSAPRYLPGPLLFELGLAIGSHDHLRDAGREAVEHIARRLGGIAAFTLMSGQDAVCCAHAGRVEIKAMSFAVGDRRPLVMNSAGVSMLVCLPAGERRAATTYGLARARHLGEYRVRMIRAMIERSARLGYGFNQNNTVAGITGIAVAILNAQALPVASLSVSGTSEQFSEDAMDHIVMTLRHEAGMISV